MDKMLEQQKLLDCVKKEILSNKDLLEIRKVLVYFKNKGMPQNCMYDCLQKLRYLDEEDIILELMDFVVGFCKPELAIYS